MNARIKKDFLRIPVPMYLAKYFFLEIQDNRTLFFPLHFLHLPRRQSAAGRGLGTMLPRTNLLYENDIVGPCESVLEFLRHHFPAQRTSLLWCSGIV
jgi:hypothetical protein